VSIFDIAAVVLILATAIGIINERLFGIPRVIAQLLGSLVLSLGVILVSHATGDYRYATLLQNDLSGAHLPQILLNGVLALLLFAASLNASLHDLRANAVSVFCLATIGVLLSTTFFTISFWGVLHALGMAVPIVWCFVLGAILAPTDAVAVEGLLRHSPLPDALKTTIIGESLFNDGTALVLFVTALAAVEGQHHLLGHGHVATAMIIEGGGGIALGMATGFAAAWIMSLIRDDEIAIFASLALALGTYRLATALGVSGPIGVVVAGIVLANRTIATASERERRQKVGVFWALIDNLLNVLLFVLLGFEIFAMNLSWLAAVSAAIAIPLAFLSRFFSVGLPLWLFRQPLATDKRVPFLLTWLGLRGAISVALVQIIPQGPYNDALLAACYAVVIFTVVIQGLSTPRVIAAIYGNRAGTTPV
jgi:CPA1 family monovalent cation:H+ antiporter